MLKPRFKSHLRIGTKTVCYHFSHKIFFIYKRSKQYYERGLESQKTWVPIPGSATDWQCDCRGVTFFCASVSPSVKWLQLQGKLWPSSVLQEGPLCALVHKYICILIQGLASLPPTFTSGGGGLMTDCFLIPGGWVRVLKVPLQSSHVAKMLLPLNHQIALHYI